MKVLGSKIAGAPADIYYTWDTVNHVTDMAAVFPITDSSKPVHGAMFFAIPSSAAYMVSVKGPYSQLNAAHGALMRHLVTKGKKSTLEIEEYIKGPQQEKDSSKWETNIYYLVQ